MHADFELMQDGHVKPGRGGARPGSGRKPEGYQKPEETLRFEIERTRNEKAKADLNELEFKIKSGEYMPRAAFQQAGATMLATLAQTMRSLPDMLERKANLSPEEAELVERVVDECLEGLAEDLKMLTGGYD